LSPDVRAVFAFQVVWIGLLYIAWSWVVRLGLWVRREPLRWLFHQSSENLCEAIPNTAPSGQRADIVALFVGDWPVVDHALGKFPFQNGHPMARGAIIRKRGHELNLVMPHRPAGLWQLRFLRHGRRHLGRAPSRKLDQHTTAVKNFHAIFLGHRL